jgi:aryl-alcohol dehydrogenase-like predicted oxidoreductase
VAQGVLTGKYQPGQAPPEGTRARDAKGGADMIERWMSDDVLTGVQRLQPIADEIGLTMAQLAIAWVLQNPNIAAAIIGASRPEQVAANVNASGVTLDADVLTAIDDAIGSLAERYPALSTSPETREA